MRKLRRCCGTLSQAQEGCRGTSTSISPEHLVDGLRAAGLIVARPVQWRMHP
jgi:hypothetical protein